LRPAGAPQERVLTILAAVARPGTAWIDELVAELAPVPSEHVLATL
jgi:hypothetical protein